MIESNSRIFISYSHCGAGPQWKSALLRALHVFENQHLLDVWNDDRIRASQYWDTEIKQAMSDASVAVVLLTKEALESQYILDTEFPFLRIRQRHDNVPVFLVVCMAEQLINDGLPPRRRRTRRRQTCHPWALTETRYEKDLLFNHAICRRL